MFHRFFAQQKRQTIVWCFLCIAVFLTCFPSYFLNQADYSLADGSCSSTLQSGTARGTRPYPDFLNEHISRSQNPFLLARSAASNRIPMRLPVPHFRISFVLFTLAGLYVPCWRRMSKRNRDEATGDYIIRYIHDQDGETYRPSFLF